ncbi:complement factor I-like [Anarrhichthys ocellatus]|uniref:complement factor I-like n=1 Tax=Anarrhichthys ocellatus TaxID=433405 RepID=UPI0012EEB5DF|nr:complement factor I-like [Anarrhichthys ocellatus]
MFVKMRSAGLSVLLVFLLILISRSEMVTHNQEKQTTTTPPTTPVVTSPAPTTPVVTSPAPTTPLVTSPAPTTPETPKEDEFLGPLECLKKKFTRGSCDLVFCRPWERCIDGHCSCKPPYLCPAEGVHPVCGLNNRNYRSYCQVMALSCYKNRPAMSHFGGNCEADQPKFTSTIDPETGVVKIFIPDPVSPEGVKELLVCWKIWNMAAANVACKNGGNPLGAVTADSRLYSSLTTDHDNKFPKQCVSVRCQGYETSLAECEIYDKTNIGKRKVATATCHTSSLAPGGQFGF